MEQQKPQLPDTERWGDFNPEKIASLFDSSARLSHYEVLVDTQTQEEAERIPVFQIDIVDPTTLGSITLLIKPDKKTVSTVAHSLPVDLINFIRQGGRPPLQLDVIPKGTLPTHIAVLDNIQRVEINDKDKRSTSIVIKFIKEDDNSFTKLEIFRDARLRFSSISKSEYGDSHALRIEDAEN